MPVQYASLLEEHHAVRQRAGLFDVSHMGEIEIRGVGIVIVPEARHSIDDTGRAGRYATITTNE